MSNCKKCGGSMYNDNLKDDDCPLFVVVCSECGYIEKVKRLYSTKYTF